MNHNYVVRVGAQGVDHWKCQAPECGEEGPLREMQARPCRGPRPTKESQDRDLLDAITGKDRR